jgi:CheY-like chemotaxis protein
MIYAGLILFILSAIINLLQTHPGYPEWFLNSIYPFVSVVKFLFLAGGALLFITGLVIYFSYWGERDRELENNLTKLKLLDNLQQESKYPFPVTELLDRILKSLLGGLDETSGAIFLFNRTQRQFLLTSSVGLAKEEVALLEYYPYGRNIISQALEEENPLISSDFRSLGGKAQLAVSRFHSILVIPLLSGRNKIGALLFFSPDEKRYDREYIALLNPIAEWLSEKVQVGFLGRELNKNTRELEARKEQLDDYFKKLDRLIKCISDVTTPKALAEKCLGLAGSDEIWILGLTGGHLQILGGTMETPDFGDNFQTALIGAISKNKAMILNQEGTDDSGQNFIARSSLLMPINGQGNAILLRNNTGPMELNEADLKTAELIAGVAGLVVGQTSARNISDSRSRGQEAINKILRLKISGADIDKEFKSFLEELERIVFPDTKIIVYRRVENIYRPIFHENAGIDINDIEIASGEGSTGQAAVSKMAAMVWGDSEVEANLFAYDEENRNLLLQFFGDRARPQFQGDYPLIVDGRTETVITLFGFNDSSPEYMELHRLVSVLTGLYNLKMEIGRIGNKNLSAGIEPALLTMKVANDLNNDLAAISGHCQIILRDPNLPGETVSSIDIILKTIDKMSEQVRALISGRDKREKTPIRTTDLNLAVRESLRKSSISGNLHMIGGRPLEFDLKLEEIPTLKINPDDFVIFLESAWKSFTESINDDEIITLSTYKKNGHIYIDISRHRKNFPPVEAVAGFGRYMEPQAMEGHFKDNEFIGKLISFSGQFAFDKYSRIPSYYSFRFPEKRIIEEFPEKQSSRELTILAVDDQVVILELLVAMCQSMGYKILTARNATDSLALFQQHRPDLVIADLMMPEMSGLELARRLNELSPQIPIIMITGWGASVDSEKLRKAGIDHILYKPFRLEQLADLISKIRLSLINK